MGRARDKRVYMRARDKRVYMRARDKQVEVVEACTQGMGKEENVYFAEISLYHEEISVR